jgi:lipopolysaccharide export system permease protein
MRLDMYLTRVFFLSFITVLAVMCCISILVEMTELIRKYNIQQVSIEKIFKLSLLHLPEMMYRILPLIILIATLAMYLNLARTSELVIIRASKRSAIRSLLGPTIATLFIGLFSVFFLNPIIASTSKYYDLLIHKYSNSSAPITTILEEGLWIWQGGTQGKKIIQASKSNSSAQEFSNVSIYGFDVSGKPSYRINAEDALLEAGSWRLRNATFWDFSELSTTRPEGINFSEFLLETDVTPEQIKQSFSKPNTIPLWKLPALVRRLDQTGFPSIEHRVWFQMELANPIFLISMLFIASAFVTKHTRVSNSGFAILTALILGFSIYFLKNFSNVLGQNFQIPVLVSAWAPPLIGISISLGFLLHLEDG